MIDLDTRARAAAGALQTAVEKAPLRLATRPPHPGHPARPWLAFAAGVATAAAVVVGVINQGPIVASEVSTTTTLPSTTTTVAAVETTSPTTTVAAAGPVETTTAPDTAPPALEITSPEDGFETEDPRIEFAGVTEPGARVLAGEYEAEVRGDGTWSIVLLLSPGENRTRFVAVDASGNAAEAWVTVVLVEREPDPTTTTTEPSTTTTKPEEPEEPTTTIATVPFAANATFGECAETPPYDVYYGTGRPGLVIEVTSPYGSARREVGDSGEWDLTVFFESAPVGEHFDVVVETSDGDRAVFDFVRLG